MLKITVVAVGKLKEKFWVAACDEYLKRLRPYAKVTVVEIPDVDPARPAVWRRLASAKAQAFWRPCRRGAHVILMAIEGKQRSSVDLLPSPWTIWLCAAQASSRSSSAVPTV